MDVRCEKCQTEYELDESKITEAGVTVKCTSCGNLFKIRRRPQSSVGPLPPPSDAAASDRLWLIRNPDGEIQRFRELTTLQQWIVEQKVTRECEISRTGETWKRLGDITELASFFIVVEQAQAAARAAAEKAAPRKSTQPMGGPIVQPARSGPSPVPSPLAAVTAAPAAFGDPTRRLQAMPEPRLSPVAPPQAPTLLPSQAPTLVPSELSATQPMIRPAASPAPQPLPAQAPVDGEPSGPTGGLRLPAGGNEPAWAGDGQSSRQLLAADLDDDLGVYRPPKRRTAWVVLSLLLVAGAGVGVYFGVIRPKQNQGKTEASPKEPTTPTSTTPTSTTPTSTTPTSTTPTSTTPTSTTPTSTTPTVVSKPAAPDEPETLRSYREALVRFDADTDAAFDQAEALLAKAHVDEPDQEARVLAALAIMNAARSQALTDDAEMLKGTDRKQSAARKAEAGKRLAEAEKLAREADKKGPKVAEAQIAMAEVKRQQKRKGADVERHLAGIDSPEAHYVRGMLLHRDGKSADAQTVLAKALQAHVDSTGREHLRARYRLAAIALDDKRWEDAREQLDRILAAESEHARARALRAAVDRKEAEAKPTAPTAPPPGDETKPPADPGTGPVSAEAYDGLVAKGDKLAENGDCTSAMKYYERALDARPGGVEALTGLGYCYLDQKQYTRAVANFRAALGISSRFGDALIGIAEAYRFQGNNGEAVTYYQKYLDAHPNGPKAAIARRYVNDLGTASPPPPPPPPEEKPPQEGASGGGAEPPKEEKPPEPKPEAPVEKIETPPGG